MLLTKHSAGLRFAHSLCRSRMEAIDALSALTFDLLVWFSARTTCFHITQSFALSRTFPFAIFFNCLHGWMRCDTFFPVQSQCHRNRFSSLGTCTYHLHKWFWYRLYACKCGLFSLVQLNFTVARVKGSIFFLSLFLSFRWNTKLSKGHWWNIC